MALDSEYEMCAVALSVHSASPSLGLSRSLVHSASVCAISLVVRTLGIFKYFVATFSAGTNWQKSTQKLHSHTKEATPSEHSSSTIVIIIIMESTLYPPSTPL